MDLSDIVQLLTPVAFLVVWLAIILFTLGLAMFDLRRLKEHYKTGLTVAVYLFMLLVPSLVFRLVYFDADAVAEQMKQRGASPQLMALELRAGPAFAALRHVLRLGWYVVVYCAAASEWKRVHPQDPPLLRSAERAPAAPMLGALVCRRVPTTVRRLADPQSQDTARRMASRIAISTRVPGWRRRAGQML